MAGRNNQSDPMRGHEQHSRDSRYEQYGEGAQDERMNYGSEPLGGAEPLRQGQD